MATPTAAEAAIARAEEEAHVAAELDTAGGGQGLQEPMTLEQMRKHLEAVGSRVGGLVSSAEMVTIYNRYDGVSSDVTTDQIRQRLRVRFDRTHPWEGQLVWTTKPPEKAPEKGNLKCPLHSESEERAYLDILHFDGKTCRKATMKTQYDVGTHFEKAHKRIYLAVEKDKERQIQLQQMELMREQTAAMQAMAAAQGVGAGVESCGEGGCDYKGSPQQLRGHKMGAHPKEPVSA